MAKEKKGIHYAFVIFIGCCFFSAGSMALTMGTAGVYLLPLGEALNLGPGEVALWIAVSGPATAVAMPVWGWLIQTKNINFVSTAAALMMIAAILFFAFADSLWQLLVAGLLIGAALPSTFGIIAPILLGNWFDERVRGRMLGIATACTGVGTFVWAPLFAVLIQSIGLQATFLVNAAICAVFLLPFSLFVFKTKPEDKGLKPYGYDPNASVEQAEKALETGVGMKTAMKTPVFWVFMLCMTFTAICMGYGVSQPKYAAEFLAGTMDPANIALFGATMISVSSVMNILANISFGVLADKFGLRLTFIVFWILFALGFVFWLIMPNPAGLLIGAFLLGAHAAFSAVGYPLVIRKLFGSKNYPKIMSYLIMPGSFIGSFGASMIGFTYTQFGSYTFSIYLGLAFVVLFAVTGLWTLTKIGTVKFDDVPETAELPEVAEESA